MRAASTVVDVTVFLLLVGVAVTTLGLSTTVEGPRGSDETGLLLSSSTTSVTYESAVPDRSATEPSVTRESTVHGTYAGLLGRAAVANVSITDEDESLWSAPAFGAAVTADVAALLDRRRGRFEVRATWEPYPDAPVSGTHVVGRSPPPGVDVAATTLSVPTHVDQPHAASIQPADGEFDALATAVADRIVDGVFETRRGASRPVAPESIRTARTELRSALHADMRERFESPEAARDAIDLGSLTVTVRQWSP